MKKQIAALLTASLALVAFAGCGQGNNNNGHEDNTDPVISGVNETAFGEEGVEFNALAGVTAYDEEDGDITSSIEVEADGLTFTDGIATPTVAGEYELIYSVTDSDKATSYAYCTLTVTRALAPEQTIVDYTFTDSGATVNQCGWSHVIASPATGNAECKTGAYILNVTNPGNAQDDVALTKSVDLPAGSHSVSVWAKADSTTYGKIVIKNEVAAIVKEMNAVEIGAGITEIKLEFELEAELHGEICLCLGKMDNTPAAYSVTVIKAERVQTTGSSNKINRYVEDFSESAASVTANFWGDSTGSVTNNNGAAQVNITKYPTADDHVWETHFFIALGSNAIEAGKVYSYSVDVTAQNAQNKVEFALGQKGDVDSGIYDTEGGFSYNMAFTAGAKKTLTGTFTASKDLSDPALLFKVGNYSESAGLTNNVYTIDNVEFYEVGAGTTVDTKTFTDRFEATGGTEQPWVAYHEGESIGALYTEQGKLIYRADMIDGVDYHNKIVVGRGASLLDLPADAYITVSITVKATKNVSCAMHLFRQNGGWDIEDDRPTKNLSDANPARNRFNITTEEQTLSITLEKTLIEAGKFELQLQDFKCADGSVTIEISALKITYRALS